MHIWFRGMDWVGMGKRTLEAPFVPPLKDEDDTRCDHTLCSNSLPPPATPAAPLLHP